MSEPIDLIPEKRAAPHFLSTSVGGNVVPGDLQMQLEKEGFNAALREDDKRWLTKFGDKIRRGRGCAE